MELKSGHIIDNLLKVARFNRTFMELKFPWYFQYSKIV